MRPLPELPATAARLGDGTIHESLVVIDVSLGGLALATEGSLVDAKVGDRFALRLDMGPFGAHRADVIVRWAAEQQTGVEIVDLLPDVGVAIRRYVAELLERGAAS
jgi:hypothetical protein